MAAAARVYRLRLELQHVKPTIWREVEVHSAMSLEGLHRAIQIVMGWDDDHLWTFEAGGRRFELPDDGTPDFMKAQDAAEVTVEAVLPTAGSRLRYDYDFGDGWRVFTVVSSIGEREKGVRYPRCVAGARAGPLEDSGGPPGYEQLLAARKNPRSRDAKQRLEWAGPDWDPDQFDIEAVNKKLARLPAPRRLH